MLSTGFMGGNASDIDVLNAAFNSTVARKDNSYFGDSLRMLALLMMNGDFVRYNSGV